MFRSALDALRRGISKTAAAVGGGLRGVLKGKDLDEDLIDRIESTLVASDMGVRIAREVVDEVRRAFRGGTAKRGSDAVGILKERLKDRLRGSDLSLAKVAEGPTVILVVGVNGSGKTTSVAKIAKALKDEGRSVLLAAGDTFRAGAVAQLEVWAKRLDIDVVATSFKYFPLVSNSSMCFINPITASMPLSFSWPLKLGMALA